MTQIEVARGTTFPITLEVYQDGSRVNLTGKDLVFTAGTTPNLVKKTNVNGSGFTVVDSDLGVALIELSVAETRSFTGDSVPFSVEIWESSGAVQTLLLEGEFKVRTVVNTDV